MSRRSAEEWRVLVEEWNASGQGCKEFALPRGLGFSALGWWRWKLGLGPKRPVEPVTAFLDVVVAKAERTAPDLVVEVGAVRVRVAAGFDASELRRLVDALC